jgi:transcriptional regulator with XRE-family HTH domain
MDDTELDGIMSRLAVGLSRARFERGLSRVELMGHTGLSHTAIVKVEHAQSAPTVKTLVKLADALKPEGATTGEFLGRLLGAAVDDADR